MTDWTKVEKTLVANVVQYNGEDVYYEGKIVVYGDGVAWSKLSKDSATWTTVS